MPMSMRWWLVAVALVMGAGTRPGPAQAAAPPTYYARLQFAQDKKATVYLSFQNSRMRVGRSLAELESAPPVRAKESQIDGQGSGHYFQFYGFPEIDLPVTVAGYAKVKGRFQFHRSRSRTGLFGRGRVRESTFGYGDVILIRRDSSGVDWGYVLGIGVFDQEGEGQPGNSKDYPATTVVPQVDDSNLSFAIETKMEGRKARIGLQIRSGKTDISNVLRNGKGAPVTLEVTDKGGKVIVSEKGDPAKFGFT